MSSDFGPLLIGVAAAGLLVLLAAIVQASRQVVARVRLWLGQDRGPESRLDPRADVREAQANDRQERRRDGLWSEAKADAERNAAEITEDARREAHELLQEARLEAAKIVAAAGDEHARLVEALARERLGLEDTRTELSGFLTGALDEVESVPAANDSSADVHDLDEVRTAKSTGAERALP
jgi:hypothetical protein